jgi:hypothetical protein
LEGKRSDARYCSTRCQSVAGSRRERANRPGIEARRWRQKTEEQKQRSRERNREWYRANKARSKALNRRFVAANPNIHVLYQHGIHPTELQALHTEQGGRCAICDKPGAVRGPGCLFIDHDHTTGERRGLICHEYNKALPVWERMGPTWALRVLTYLGDPPLRRMRRRRDAS